MNNINDNNYKLLFTAQDCLNSIKNSIKNAEKSIDIEIFYFKEDSIGLEFLNLLIEKSNQGLKIRLLLDHVGSYDLSNSKILTALKRHGIHVSFFNSLLPFSKNSKTIWYLRNHRRSIIIDNKYVFLGSFCIGHFTLTWIELGILIKDIIFAKKVQTVFDKTWKKVYKPTFNIGSVSKKDLMNNKDNDFNHITQSPIPFKRHIYKYYLNSIKAAKKEITLVSPYFTPDLKFNHALIKARKRNVKINIITPKNTDWYIVDLARNTHINNLLKNKINFYLHNQMVHSKFAVFDNNEAYLGTMNLDNLSLRYNYENGVKINNQSCVTELSEYIEKTLLPECTKININSWKNRPLTEKILEKFVYIIRGLL